MREAAKKRLWILALIPVGISAALLLCCALFARGAPYIWHLSLLPLLFSASPLHALRSIPEHAGERPLIDQRRFLCDGLYPKLNFGVAAFIVGFAVWLACFLGIRAEQDPDLWGPLLVFFMTPWLISAIFLLLARGEYRERRRMLDKHTLVIAQLPLLRKESSVYRDSDGESHTSLTFYFPDIPRGIVHTIGGQSYPAHDEILLSVDSVEFARGQSGGEYYVFLNNGSLPRPSAICCYPRDAVVLDQDLGLFVRDLEGMKADYEAQREQTSREEAWIEEQLKRKEERRQTALRMGGDAAEEVRAEMRAEARSRRRRRFLFVLAAIGCGICCLVSIPLSVGFIQLFSEKLAPLSAFPPLIILFGQFFLLMFLSDRLWDGRMAPAVIFGCVNVAMVFLGVGLLVLLV